MCREIFTSYCGMVLATQIFLPVVVILLLALLGSCDLVVQLLIITPTAFVLILVLVFILHVYMSIIQQSTVKMILHL